MDKVLIKNMVFMGCHGCDDQEKVKQQPFNIDIELYIDLDDSMENDYISSTVDYSAVYALVRNIVEVESFNLIERLASVIIDAIRTKFPIKGIKILIKKPNAPIDGQFDYVGVEIERSFNE